MMPVQRRLHRCGQHMLCQDCCTGLYCSNVGCSLNWSEKIDWSVEGNYQLDAELGELFQKDIHVKDVHTCNNKHTISNDDLRLYYYQMWYVFEKLGRVSFKMAA